jgi:hypothetical protein
MSRFTTRATATTTTTTAPVAASPARDRGRPGRPARLLSLLALSVALFAAVASSSETNEPNQVEEVSGDSATTEPGGSGAAPDDGGGSGQPEVFAVGDLVELGDGQLRVHGATDPVVSDDDFFQPAPGHRWVAVENVPVGPSPARVVAWAGTLGASSAEPRRSPDLAR